MFKKIMLAALAASALALNAPVAQADDPSASCGFDSVQQETATGQSYEGAAYGYAVHADGGTVSVRCVIRVNGTEVDSTPTGTGTGVATTQGRVSFLAEDTDNVELCTQVTAHGETTEVCDPSTNTQVPPQAVIDALDDLFDLINGFLVPVDDAICPVLKGLAGTYGPITIAADGDVSIDPLGGIWDCPPYAV